MFKIIPRNTKGHPPFLRWLSLQARECEQDGIQKTKVGLLRPAVLANPAQHYACLSGMVHFSYNK